jgi:hypothetical protein
MLPPFEQGVGPITGIGIAPSLDIGLFYIGDFWARGKYYTGISKKGGSK